MNVMKKKLSKTGGFTLVEMLIVVAIIAILILVSIPLISSSLEKARHSVDDANERDAQSLATVYYLTLSPQDIAGFTDGELELTYYVNANNQGRVDVPDSTTGNGPEGYETVVSTCTNGDDCAGRPTLNTVLTVTIDKEGNIVETSWHPATP